MVKSEGTVLFCHDIYGELTSVIVEGKVYLVGVELTKLLGYKGVTRALKYNVPDEHIKKVFVECDTCVRSGGRPLLLIDQYACNILIDKRAKFCFDLKEWINNIFEYAGTESVVSNDSTKEELKQLHDRLEQIEKEN